MCHKNPALQGDVQTYAGNHTGVKLDNTEAIV